VYSGCPDCSDVVSSPIANIAFLPSVSVGFKQLCQAAYQYMSLFSQKLSTPLMLERC
jgi:hypothetical protein